MASWRALEKAGLSRIAQGAMTPDNPVDEPLHYVYRVDRPTRAGSAVPLPKETHEDTAVIHQPLADRLPERPYRPPGRS